MSGAMNFRRQRTARTIGTRLVTGLLVLLAVAPVCRAEDAAIPENPAAALKQSREKALNFLRSSQADDGSFTTKAVAGIGGLVVTAALRSGLTVDDPLVQKGLKYLEGCVQEDGGIYAPKSGFRNYETCVVLLAFHEANADGRYAKIIANAEKFLRKEQIDDSEGKDKSDPEYGGAGYGGKTRPDLSNTQFLLEALKATGAEANDPAVQKALIFVSRSQNLETEFNDSPFAAKVNDGGFIYTPAAGGSSAAGTEANGGLRSYGSMTYAGLKSMIYAGLGPDDPRVKAATAWIRKHYSVSSNPGLDQLGLYYYLHTFAKALDVWGNDVIEDAAGNKHNWRQELIAQLTKSQRDNGSWINDAPRWGEGDPNLTTAFALLALSYCDEPK